MLRRKLLREMKNNFGQFFSVFILSFLAVALYTGLESNVIGGRQARADFHAETYLAEGWMFGEGFSEENLAAVRELADIEKAQLRTSLTGSAPDFDGAQIDVYLQTENLVSMPKVIDGEDFDPASENGLWLSATFAKAWDIQVGEEFTYDVAGVSVTKEIKGLIYSPEYEYMIADGDVDTDYKNIGYVYMSYAAFPVELPFTQLIFIGKGAEDVMNYEDEIARAIDNNYAVMVDESSIIGIQRLNNELTQHDAFSLVFAIVFVIIAILVIVTTMSRMVDKQRTQIGTMNALGLKRSKIILHYISYSFWVSLAGAVVGFLLGTFVIGKAMVDMFSESFAVPGWRVGYNANYLILVAAVVGACTLSAYFSTRKILKVKPSEALRPAPPKEGKNCIFEKLPFWNKLGFSARYNLRDISRSPLRAVMGIFGTACGMLMVTWIFGCDLMLDNLYNWNFETIQNYDYQLVLEDGISVEDADALCMELSGELIYQDQIEVALEPYAVSSEKSTHTLTVLEGKGMMQITNSDLEAVELEAGTVAITQRLADDLGIGVGDIVYWHIYTENEWYEAEIGVINRSPETSGITMLRADFEKTDNPYKPMILATNQDVSAHENDQVAAIYSTAEMRTVYEENMSMIYLLVAVMAIFAVVMVVVVLYNSGNLSFNERVKEFATLKVMGLSSNKIRRLISLQNVWLSVIGILLGAPFAKMGLKAMINSNGENFDYPTSIPFFAYIISGMAILLVSMGVSYLFSKRIKNLDMVETLKGME